jgi:hypothetical protein
MSPQVGMTELDANKWCAENRVVVSYAVAGKVKVMWGHAGGGETEGPRYLDAVIQAREELQRRARDGAIDLSSSGTFKVGP